MPPWLVRNFILPLHERLVGRNTMQCWRELEKSQWFSLDELRELQRRKLQNLLLHAWKECPAHRARLQQAGLTESDLRQFETSQLEKLPLLDKATIRSEMQGLVAWKLPGGVFKYATGGSTGSPLIFYFDRRRQAYDKAARMRTHAWFGVQPGEKELYLWGAPAELSKQDRIKNWRDSLTNQVLLSAFEMTPARMRQYLARMQAFRPDCLFGYPSSLAVLARFAQESRIDCVISQLKAVFPTGEVLFPHQRQLLQETFQVPVANCYGSRDAGFISHECPQGTMHITAENIILEVIGPDERCLPDGEQGELVVTHLDNYALPFMRYRTGDLGRIINKTCECGRRLPSMEICDGRMTDQLHRSDGAVVHALALIYSLREIPGVQEFKIRQRSVDAVQVSLVTNDQYAKDSETSIETQFRLRLGRDVQVEFNYLSQIPAERSGKHRYVVSDIGMESEKEASTSSELH